MARVVIRRLMFLVPTLFFVTLAVFSLQQLLPGDPAVTLAGGTQATVEEVERVREEFGFDDPFWSQYGRWVADAVRLDFGESLASGREVRNAVLSRLPITFSLALAGLVTSLLIGIPLGILSALNPGSRLDRFAIGFTTLGISVPGFWLGMVLILLLAVQFQIFPTSGYRGLAENPLEWAFYLVLPGVSLGLASAATVARQLRASLIDVLDSNYIRTAWAKGGGQNLVVAKHALKNAAIPVVTIIGLQLNVLLGGAVITELIFGIPGLGLYMLQSIAAPDLAVIQGITVLFVLLYVGVNLVVDLTYMLLDPRVRTS